MIKTDKTLTEVKKLFEQGKLKSYSQCDYTGKVSYILKEEPKAPKKKILKKKTAKAEKSED